VKEKQQRLSVAKCNVRSSHCI